MDEFSVPSTSWVGIFFPFFFFFYGNFHFFQLCAGLFTTLLPSQRASQRTVKNLQRESIAGCTAGGAQPECGSHSLVARWGSFALVRRSDSACFRCSSVCSSVIYLLGSVLSTPTSVIFKPSLPTSI